MKCSKCDGEMVLRHGETDFWGCSNFGPLKCKETLSLEEMDSLLKSKGSGKYMYPNLRSSIYDVYSTYDEFGKDIGYSGSMVSGIVTGSHDAKDRFRLACVHVLGSPEEWLFEGNQVHVEPSEETIPLSEVAKTLEKAIHSLNCILTRLQSE